MDLNLKDRVAVVTGGAAGIGEAIARALAAEGCIISILDRDAAAARKAAAALIESGHQAQSIACDIGDAAAPILAEDGEGKSVVIQHPGPPGLEIGRTVGVMAAPFRHRPQIDVRPVREIPHSFVQTHANPPANHRSAF